MLLIDSGLQTVAPLDFTKPGLLDESPDTIVARLAEAQLLPNLADRRVVLSGIGYTAEPQTPLDDRRHANLVDLWQKIVARAGAREVVTVATPNTTPSPAGLPEVTKVPVPPIPALEPRCNTQLILPDNGAVGFRPDSTDFRDGAAARQTLAGIGEWLARTPTASAHLVGSVAHHGADRGNAGLSRERALRVRAVLIEQGARAGQITAEGEGWGPFPSKNAAPDPVSDPLNRRVVVRLICR